jgi:hypothetical protein
LVGGGFSARSAQYSLREEKGCRFESRVRKQQIEEEDWPPSLPGKSSISPGDLRKHFQEMTIRAVATWLANEARAHSNVKSLAYDALIQVLDRTSVMSRITWLLPPD